MSKLDLLGLLHSLGFSIKESQAHVFYASKYSNGHLIIFGSDDINTLYRIAINTPAQPITFDKRFNS